LAYFFDPQQAFLAGAFFLAAVFFATVFLAAGFGAAAFFATVFLAAVFFLAVVFFFAAVFFTALFFGAAFTNPITSFRNTSVAINSPSFRDPRMLYYTECNFVKLHFSFSCIRMQIFFILGLQRGILSRITI